MSNPTYTTRTSCRICGSTDLAPLFSLGTQYVSNFLTEEEHLLLKRQEAMGTLVIKPIVDEMMAKGILPKAANVSIDHGTFPKCPIDLELCKHCTLVQAKHIAPQELLYKRTYWYKSGVTTTMRAALADVARAAERAIGLIKPNDVVLDIGSNDGTLLSCYPAGVKVGVEPATNLATEGSKGLDVFINDFWSANAYHEAMRAKFPHGKTLPKIITACGMFYDLEDPNQFIADVAKVLHPEGVFIAQLMCLKGMLELRDVGNLAHEHLEFYSLRSLDHLLNKHGLEMFDIEENSVNGRSYRLCIGHKDAHIKASERLRNARQAEEDMRLADPQIYATFSQEMQAVRRKVVKFVLGIYPSKAWVYGASTKGNVILQWLGLDSRELVGAADRSPSKWGKVMVGSGIPIVAEEAFRAASPDFALVLPYAFLDEMIKREWLWLESGGKFIVPLPVPKLISVHHDNVMEELL